MYPWVPMLVSEVCDIVHHALLEVAWVLLFIG